jgi:lipid II:glycine glycyltransferase (peptidoglycan interpeptide bridge formation enzyme)
MIDIRQTSQYANYLNNIGWEIERVENVNYFIKKIPVLGSVLKVQRPERLRLQTIQSLANKHRSFQVIIEPKDRPDTDLLISAGYKLSRSPYLPTKTLRLDIELSDTRLLKNMQKDARAAISKNAETKIISSDPNINTTYNHNNIQYTIGEFRGAWKDAVGFKRYVPPLSHLINLKKAFKENCLFELAEDKSAGAIFLTRGLVAYYWQAFTNKHGRKTLVQYKIVWKGILWSKARGAKVFDFEGIYDERFPQKSWLGFSHFKKSFGGKIKEYPGAFTKIGFRL